MNDFRINDDDALTLIDLRAILDWLATPPSVQAEDELAPLHKHLTALRDTRTAAHQRHKVLDLLYDRTQRIVTRLLPDLVGVALPLSRRVRHTVRGMQGVLLMVAEDYLATLDELDDHLVKGLRRPPEQTVWRAIDALARHQLISNHAASPYGSGVWKLANRAYRIAREGGYADVHLRDTEGTIEDVYLRACLLACTQPASFTSREIGLVVDYIRRFGSRATLLPQAQAASAEGVFWVDLDRDMPPTSANRRPPPEGALCFACEQLAQLAEEQVDALAAGAGTDDLDLPATAATPAGHGVLRRLAQHWGHPGKRRFLRRRQNYRAVLCVGLPALWQLFREQQTLAGDLTSWMVTNESPDGYAVMHVSGKTSRLAAGDVVALRTENSSDWQVCIVRWALSENPEHLELGLQILATRATAATLANPAVGDAGGQLPVLLLPALPPLHPTEALVAAVGTTLPQPNRMILLVERDNLEVRQVRAIELKEQTASIEIVAIEPDTAP
ncbi:MAG: hypothetical protein HYU78_01835 [Rhodocyclales bacterium]|nr:hypothetical protein [Rhodocyclales bacterium]